MVQVRKVESVKTRESSEDEKAIFTYSEGKHPKPRKIPKLSLQNIGGLKDTWTTWKAKAVKKAKSQEDCTNQLHQ